MPQVGDALDAVLLGCFLFGLLLAAVSLLLGHADLDVHLGHSGHAGHAGHGHGHGGRQLNWLPLSLGALMVLVAWFGGVGYLLRWLGWPIPLALGAAAVLGFGVATLVELAIDALARATLGEVRAEDDRLPGTIGRVASPIRAGGVGEVVYEQRGVRHVTAARAHDGLPLPRGEEVVVVGFDRGMATVVPLDVAMVGDEDRSLGAGGGRGG